MDNHLNPLNFFYYAFNYKNEPNNQIKPIIIFIFAIIKKNAP